MLYMWNKYNTVSHLYLKKALIYNFYSLKKKAIDWNYL